jgi:hypothetical protein
MVRLADNERMPIEFLKTSFIVNIKTFFTLNIRKNCSRWETLVLMRMASLSLC